jgi:energy-coupling factor transporter ATP-binding protein EcfA2
MTKVIAITGCMGSGKTTLVHHLHQLIPGSEVLFEDHFQTMTQMDMAELEQWKDRGSSIGELNLNGFDRAIREALGASGNLRAKEPKLLPPKLLPPKLLIIESQFGRAHPSLADLVDYQIWIDAPLDLCLARKILQLLSIDSGDSNGAMRPVEIRGLCKLYLESTARLLREQIRQVASVSDATLVNDKNTARMVDEALQIVVNRASGSLGLDSDWL